MKEIVIISKAAFGGRAAPIGMDKGINPFKKGKSKLLRDALQNRINELGLDYHVVADNGTNDPKKIIKDGAILLLISPYVKSYIDLSEIPNDAHLTLTEEEYLKSDVDRIIEFIR